MIKKIIFLLIIGSNLFAGRYIYELVRICEEKKNSIKKIRQGKVELDLLNYHLETLEGIEQVDVSGFDGVNFSGNHIKSLEPLAALKPNTSQRVKGIYLMSNQISTFSESTINNIKAAFPNLTLLDLINNPLEPASITLINKFNKNLSQGFLILHSSKP